MAATHVELGKDLEDLLDALGDPVEQTVRELIVIELYRRQVISSGKAAELLQIPRQEFIQRASALGLPYLRLSEDDWRAEVEESKRG